MPEKPSQEQLLDYFANHVSPQKVKMYRTWGVDFIPGPMPDFRPLRPWAGATFLAETEIEIHRPGVWATEETHERFRRMIDVWAREARIR